jgi:flavodoxin
MNTLVVYDSQFGNTEKIAQAIAQALTEYGTARAMLVGDYTPDALQGVDMLVVGCPTQAWHSTEHIQTFIKQLEHQTVQNLCVAEFDTRLDKPSWLTGSAAKGMAKSLRPLGAQLLSPESFLVTGKEGPLVEGEVERAAEWARTLYDEYEVQNGVVAAPQ